MRDLNQLILNFDYEQNFKDQDFYVSKSNYYPFQLINSWPKWEKNFLNLYGEKFSGFFFDKYFFKKLIKKFGKFNSSQIDLKFYLVFH